MTNVVLYNKSARSFILSEKVTIRAGSHLEVEKALAEKGVKDYPKELSLIKDAATSNAANKALEAELATAKAKIAELESGKAGAKTSGTTKG